MTRVLVIKTSSMGDVVHNVPVIADLRQARPELVIDWVVEEAYTELVGLVRGVSRVVPLALRRWRRSPHRRAVHDERRAFEEALRAEPYDVILDTQGLLKSAFVGRRARLLPGGRRVGFSLGLVREPLARLFYDRGHAVDPRLHAIERMRALAGAAFGYVPAGPPRFEFDVPSRAFPWLAAGGGGYAVLLHATARPEKAWPAARWAALCDVLGAAGIVPVLPWGNEAERMAAVALAGVDASATVPAPVVTPRLSLVDCAALLAGARAVVGVDTGLLHLAAALDAPTVGLFGATPRWRYAPYWSPRTVSLGRGSGADAQPGVEAVVDSLRGLGALPSA